MFEAEPISALIVGLGNPGSEYDRTRHNVGFDVVDAMAERHNGSWRLCRQRAVVSEISIRSDRIVLAKPQTFMNVSGQSVQALVRKYGVDIDRVVIVHDELDLDLGVVRLKVGGGTAGHNGLSSIVATCKSKDFVRVRVGIGKPPGRMRGADYVLRRFQSNEIPEAEVAIEVAVEMIGSWLEHGVAATQNSFHTS